jgi:hypothetical protein
MNNELKSISLNLEEFENFRELALKFNVKFDAVHKNNLFIVKAPLEYISKWGYLEED